MAVLHLGKEVMTPGSMLNACMTGASPLVPKFHIACTSSCGLGGSPRGLVNSTACTYVSGSAPLCCKSIFSHYNSSRPPVRITERRRRHIQAACVATITKPCLAGCGSHRVGPAAESYSKTLWRSFAALPAMDCWWAGVASGLPGIRQNLTICPYL
jgi:hypothetical protein